MVEQMIQQPQHLGRQAPSVSRRCIRSFWPAGKIAHNVHQSRPENALFPVPRHKVTTIGILLANSPPGQAWTGMSCTKGATRVLASGSPSNQAKTRRKLSARAARTCCRWVLAKPI